MANWDKVGWGVTVEEKGWAGERLEDLREQRKATLGETLQLAVLEASSAGDGNLPREALEAWFIPRANV